MTSSGVFFNFQHILHLFLVFLLLTLKPYYLQELDLIKYFWILFVMVKYKRLHGLRGLPFTWYISKYSYINVQNNVTFLQYLHCFVFKGSFDFKLYDTIMDLRYHHGFMIPSWIYDAAMVLLYRGRSLLWYIMNSWYNHGIVAWREVTFMIPSWIFFDTIMVLLYRERSLLWYHNGFMITSWYCCIEGGPFYDIIMDLWYHHGTVV